VKPQLSAGKELTMFNFTDEQRTAATTLGKPMVVTAAAGSGKTTVLVARFLELLKSGLTPNEILTVTFTKEAAEQLRQRIGLALEKETTLTQFTTEVARTRFIGTIHSFCYFILQEYGSLLGLPPIEEIISEYQFQISIEEYYRKWLNSLSGAQLIHIIKAIPRYELRNLFCSFYSERHLLKRFQKEIVEEETLGILFNTTEPFLNTLEQNLYQTGRFRFDDLEHLTLSLLKNNAGIRFKLQEQFKALLIDEFQDTSQNQWAIFQELIGKNRQKLFVVGDPKQSIYSFRHADVSLFYEVIKQMRPWEGIVTELSTNFRTQSTLIKDINRFSESFFAKGHISFQPMKSGNELEGEPLRVTQYSCEDFKDKKEAELSSVLEAVGNYRREGKSLGDLALLFRQGDRIDIYAKALKTRNISSDCTQTLSLFSQLDILDLNHYFKALANPRDPFSLSAFCISPWIGMSIEELTSIRDDETALPFEEKIKHHLNHRINWFFSLADNYRITIREALLTLFRQCDYFPEPSEAFFEFLKPLTEKNYSVAEALKDLDLWKKEEILFKTRSGDGSIEAVKLMTVHASKGLEFEHVFLVDNLRRPPTQLPILLTHPTEPAGMKFRVGAETQMSPQYLKLKEIKETLDSEESRRILYVALTRAKSTLTLFLPNETKGVPKESWASLLAMASDNKL
jgi:ATP-dependent exoDNAse (exonuclease V) beta subunit